MNPIATKPMLQGEGHRSYGGFPSHLEKEAHFDALERQRIEGGRRLDTGDVHRAAEPRAKGAPLLEEVPRDLDAIIAGEPKRWKYAGAAPELQPMQAAIWGDSERTVSGAAADPRSLHEIIAGVPRPAPAAPAQVSAMLDAIRDSRSLDDIIAGVRARRDA
jgi:hypothetical protein